MQTQNGEHEKQIPRTPSRAHAARGRKIARDSARDDSGLECDLRGSAIPGTHAKRTPSRMCGGLSVYGFVAALEAVGDSCMLRMYQRLSDFRQIIIPRPAEWRDGDSNV